MATTSNAPREILARDRRLRLLQALEWSNGHTANSVVLAELLEYAGHSVPSHVLDAELAWLEDVGALVLQRKDGFSVAMLTTSGLDIARDARQLPGIARSGPEGSMFKR